MMKILIADDQFGVRSALRFLLEQEKGDCVVTEVADGESLLSQAVDLCPDVILLDAELAGVTEQGNRQNVDSLQGILSEIKAMCPKVKVIALTSRPETRRIAQSCQADVLISKTDPPENLVRVIHELCNGSTS